MPTSDLADEDILGYLEESLPADRMSVVVATGDEATGILAAAGDAIFILMAAHAHSLVRRTLFGSTTRNVLHGSACPVLFVPPRYKLPAD